MFANAPCMVAYGVKRNMHYTNCYVLLNYGIMRYTVNISFKKQMLEKVSNIVEKVKTLKEAMTYKDLIDETVDRALIKDNVTGKVTWLKE